jgi:hypothetical protein
MMLQDAWNFVKGRLTLSAEYHGISAYLGTSIDDTIPAFRCRRRPQSPPVSAVRPPGLAPGVSPGIL